MVAEWWLSGAGVVFGSRQAIFVQMSTQLITHPTINFLGPFVRILFLSIRRIVPFLIMLSLVLLGFSHAFYLLYRDAVTPSDPTQALTASEFASWLSILKVYLIMIGQGELNDTKDAQYPWLANILLFMLILFLVTLVGWCTSL